MQGGSKIDVPSSPATPPARMLPGAPQRRVGPVSVLVEKWVKCLHWPSHRLNSLDSVAPRIGSLSAMKTAAKLAVAALVAIAFSSCATTRYVSNVTRFHRLPKTGSGETFTIKSMTRAGGLEESQHLGRLAQGFTEYGWRRASSGSPDFRVLLDYAISDGRTVQGTRPIFGQTGGGTTTYHSGNLSTYGSGGGYGGATYSGTSHTPATFGVVGAVPTRETVFDRQLAVVVKDRGGNNVLEGKVTSTGSSGNLSQVLPRMIDSFFEDFPGVSGETIEVKRR